MTGDDDRAPSRTTTEAAAGVRPRLDLLAPIAGVVALFGAASFVGGDYALSLARLVVGACFLGAVSDAMLLGHWYLVQPGLGRDPIRELVKAVAVAVAVRAVVYLIPAGMVSVLNGTVDDGYGGLMGWMWVVACVTTIGLVIATWFALKERVVLGGDGRDRAAVPRHPHRLRHGPAARGRCWADRPEFARGRLRYA